MGWQRFRHFPGFKPAFLLSVCFNAIIPHTRKGFKYKIKSWFYYESIRKRQYQDTPQHMITYWRKLLQGTVIINSPKTTLKRILEAETRDLFKWVPAKSACLLTCCQKTLPWIQISSILVDPYNISFRTKVVCRQWINIIQDVFKILLNLLKRKNMNKF